MVMCTVHGCVITGINSGINRYFHFPRTLKVGVILGSLISVALWAVAMAALLVGGHGQVFVCHPLYEEPDYVALTCLLDSPGAFFKVKNNGGSEGFFSSLFYDNGTLDVPLRRVLRMIMKCPDVDEYLKSDCSEPKGALISFLEYLKWNLRMRSQNKPTYIQSEREDIVLLKQHQQKC